MKLLRVTTGVADANTYVLYNDAKEAIVIDPSERGGRISEALAVRGLTCKYVLLTHAHIDHCNGVKSLQEGGAIVYMHEGDVALLNSEYSLANAFGVSYNAFKPDFFVTDGQELSLSGEKVRVFHTPGHTSGSCCYLIDGKLYTGDTLFHMSVGRTDFPTGNYAQLCDSVHALYDFDVDYTVMPGHGPETTIFFERENNPYV